MEFVLISIGIILILGYIGIHIYYAYITLNPKRLKNTQTPNTLGMNYQDFEIEFGKKGFIRGWYIPGGNKDSATIIMAHNLGANRMKVLKYAGFLNEAGYNIVMFDFRAHGESSELNKLTGYIQGLEDDLMQVVSYVKDSSWFKASNKKIAIYGFSMGTIPTVAVSSKIPEVEAIILECGPFISVGNVFKSTFGRFVKPNRLLISSIYVLAIKVLLGKGNNFIKKAVGRVSPKAVFYIHGEKDFLISPHETRALFDNYTKEPKLYWAVPKSYHLTNLLLQPEEYKKRVLEFLSNYL